MIFLRDCFSEINNFKGPVIIRTLYKDFKFVYPEYSNDLHFYDDCTRSSHFKEYFKRYLDYKVHSINEVRKSAWDLCYSNWKDYPLGTVPKLNPILVA